jgi:O-antigen/teichoic acid export membrane protein
MEPELKPTFRQKITALLFRNQNAKQTVAKNTFWLSVSNFGGRIIKAGIVIYAARILGTAGYGVFSYAITLAGFLTLFMDPGINAILMRDASKANEDDRRSIFSTAFFLKIFLLIIGIAIIVFIAPFFSTLPGAKALLPIVAIVLAFDTLREFFSSLIRAREKMEWEAGLFLATNLAILIFGFIFLAISPSPKSLAISYAAASTFGGILAMVVLRDYFRTMASHFSPQRIFPILKSAWPFAVTGALGLLLTNTDILIISWLRSASDVGIYSAAIRIIQVLYLVPMVIQFSTLPLFSRLARVDDPKFRSILERTIGIIFIASIPLAFGGFVLGTPIMALVFGGAYASGSLAFKILMLTLLVDFPAAIISNAIFSYNHQRSLIVSSAIGGGLNVLLDIILIPPFGMVGSAFATLFAQFASNWYLWHMMKKLNPFEVVPRLKKTILAGILMGAGSAVMLITGVNVLANIAISALFYFLLLKAFREPLLAEVKHIVAPVVA